MTKPLNLFDPFLDKRDSKYIVKAINSGWVSTGGSNIKKFENKIKKFTNSKYCLAVNSGTTALDLALKCLKVNEGDAILAPTTTFISPVNVILYNKAEPIFFDLDNFLNINIDHVLYYLEKKTKKKKNYLISKANGKVIKAIIVVHVFGRPVNVIRLKGICKKYNIKIIEDASESLGSFVKFNNKKIHTGLMGDIGCMSFNANKIITTGSGGMILTNKKSYFNRAFYLSTQSKNDSIFFKHNEVGYNYRMDNLSASLGLSQFNKIKQILKKKRNDYFLYKKSFSKDKNFEIIGTPDQTICNNWLNIIKIKKKITNKAFRRFIYELHKQKINVRPIWYPNHLQKHLKKYEKFKLKKINSYMNNIICLPSSFNLKKRDIFFVSRLIKKMKL